MKILGRGIQEKLCVVFVAVLFGLLYKKWNALLNVSKKVF